MAAPVFFLIAGEASGDALGARLMRALRLRAGCEIRFRGVGGPMMLAEGLEPLFPYTELMHFGLIEVLRHVPRLLARIHEVVEAVVNERPAALVTIDAPDFCFRVAKKVRAEIGDAVPLIHYVAPTVWAWRAGRAKKVARFLDLLLAVLPFEPPYFIREGLDCKFVGHSVVESGAAKGDKQAFYTSYAIPQNAVVLVVLFGSRTSEFVKLAPVFRETVRLLRARNPSLYLAVPTVPHLKESVEAEVKGWGVPTFVFDGEKDKYDAFAAARAALACSGTIALELALALLPSVIAYKVNALTALLFRLFVHVPYVNLVNIMNEKLVVPEFLQEDCTPQKLAQAMDVLLNNDVVRHVQIAQLAATASWLGHGKFVPSERAAEAVLSASLKRQPVVLQVLPALVTGGVERGTVETAAALTQAGFKALVASAGGPMVAEVEAVGGVHITLPMASKNPFVILANIARLKRIIRSYKVDIVHVRSRAPAWSAYFAAKQCGVAFVTTFHNAYGATTRLKRWYNSAMAKGQRVIAISNYVADYAMRLYNVDREILRIIPRGVDIEKFDPAKVSLERVETLRRAWNLDKDRPVILMPGRITRWKGQSVLIQAMARMKRRDALVVIIGGGRDGVYGKELDASIRTLGLKNNIVIHDTCRDMPAAYMLADVVTVPSVRPEGFGRVVIEAQAMGIPVIATSHGGACETIQPDKTGWLTEPGDAEGLAVALDTALGLSQGDKKDLAERALTSIRTQFTTAAMTGSTLNVYRELLNENQK